MTVVEPREDSRIVLVFAPDGWSVYEVYEEDGRRELVEVVTI